MINYIDIVEGSPIFFLMIHYPMLLRILVTILGANSLCLCFGLIVFEVNWHSRIILGNFFFYWYS